MCFLVALLGIQVWKPLSECIFGKYKYIKMCLKKQKQKGSQTLDN